MPVERFFVHLSRSNYIFARVRWALLPVFHMPDNGKRPALLFGRRQNETMPENGIG